MYTYKLKDLPTAIVSIGKDSGKLQNKIHNVLASICMYWAQKKITASEAASMFTDVQKNAPWHGKSVANWIALKTKLNWSDEQECWYGQEGQKLTKEQKDSAIAEPFWVVSPPPKAHPFTDEMVAEMLEKILERQKRHEKKPVAGDDFSHKANSAIREAIALLRTEDETTS